jgi:signal transduction histidine kinase
MIDKKNRKLLSFILYITLGIGALVLCFNNNPYWFFALILYAIFSALIIFHMIYFFKYGISYSKGKPVLLVVFAIAVVIQNFDNTSFEGFYFFILIIKVLLFFELNFSLPYTVGAVFAYVFILFYKADFLLPVFWSENYTQFLPRIFLIVTAFIARYAIKVSKENRELAEQLGEKNNQLNSAMEELKQTAELRVRDKLMHDLHDNLGHTLVTASIGIQAADVLIEKDPAEAKNRLSIAAQLIREAMQSLRNVILGRSENVYEENLGFAQTILNFVTETEKRTGIHIMHNLKEDNPEFDLIPASLRSYIYKALMEGITNGIRHGAATGFEFCLTKEDEGIHFWLKDNGKGFTAIKLGYGLSKMKSEAEKLGGLLVISGQSGCILEIRLPSQIKPDRRTQK